MESMQQPADTFSLACLEDFWQRGRLRESPGERRMSGWRLRDEGGFRWGRLGGSKDGLLDHSRGYSDRGLLRRCGGGCYDILR